MPGRPTNILKPMPGRLAKEDAFLALRGASYHLWQVRHQFGKGLASNDQVELFHWHLRGFFWEMEAARDSLNREAKTDPMIKAAVDILNDQQWFKEAVAYRNFVHESFHVAEVAIPVKTGKAPAFQLRRTIPSQIRMVGGGPRSRPGAPHGRGR